MSRRTALLALVVLTAVLTVGSWPAGAHTSVKRSEPAAASTVSGPVREIVVEFFDEVRPTPTMRVSGPGGAIEVPAASLVSSNTAVRQPVPVLDADGTYEVEIDFVSGDGDAQSAGFSFDIAAPGPASGDATWLPFDVRLLRLFLHVIAATIWVGGQFVLAGLVPTLRTISTDAPRVVARAFNRIAWPAYGVLLVTGVWNLTDVSLSARPDSYRLTLLVKLVLVGASGAAAAVHATTASKLWLAVGGAVALLGSVGAVVLGLQLALG